MGWGDPKAFELVLPLVVGLWEEAAGAGAERAGFILGQVEGWGSRWESGQWFPAGGCSVSPAGAKGWLGRSPCCWWSRGALVLPMLWLVLLLYSEEAGGSHRHPRSSRLPG